MEETGKRSPLRRPSSALHLYRGSQYITSVSSLAVREWQGSGYLNLEGYDDGRGVQHVVDKLKPNGHDASSPATPKMHAVDGVFVSATQKRPQSALVCSSR